MNKTFVKAFSLILCVVMLVGSLSVLASCNKEKDVKPEEKMISIIENGASNYKIIRSEKANKNLIDIATDFRQTLIDNVGYEMEIESDFVKAGEEPDSAAYEILLGVTNRAQTQEVMDTLAPNSWAVAQKGNKIVICANNDGLLDVAIDWFASNYIVSGSQIVQIPENLNKTESFGNGLPVSINGVSSYTVVYPNNDEEMAHLADLVLRHTKLNGKQINSVTDNKPATDYEIIIGNCRRDGVKTYSGACEYGIVVDGSKVYIGASDSKTLYYAVNYFLEYGVSVQDTIVTVSQESAASGKLVD